MSSMVIITLTTIVFFYMVAERNLVDERSNAKWVEQMVCELRAAPRTCETKVTETTAFNGTDHDVNVDLNIKGWD